MKVLVVICHCKPLPLTQYQFRISPTTVYTLPVICQRHDLNYSSLQKWHINAFIVLNTVPFYSFYVWRASSEAGLYFMTIHLFIFQSFLLDVSKTASSYAHSRFSVLNSKRNEKLVTLSKQNPKYPKQSRGHL